MILLITIETFLMKSLSWSYQSSFFPFSLSPTCLCLVTAAIESLVFTPCHRPLAPSCCHLQLEKQPDSWKKSSVLWHETFPVNPKWTPLLLQVSSLSKWSTFCATIADAQQFLLSSAQKSLYWVVTVQFPGESCLNFFFLCLSSYARKLNHDFKISGNCVQMKGRAVKMQRLVLQCGRWLSSATLAPLSVSILPLDTLALSDTKHFTNNGKLTFIALAQEGQDSSPRHTWKNWDIQQQNNFAEQSCGKSKEKGMKNSTLNLVMGYYLPLLEENKCLSLDDISTGLQILFYCPLCLLSLTKVQGCQWTFWENMGQERNGAGWH